MINMMANKMMALLTGREGVDAFVGNLIAASEDFAEDHRQFEEAIAHFKSTLPDDATPSVEDLCDAIRRQITSQVIFAGYLGFQANVDHFLNPVARTFMDVEPEVYLRERVARTLPEYASAKGVIDRFREQLPPEMREMFESVAVYIAHLETIVPKVAHYEGFLLGNRLLPYALPGYQPDRLMTAYYDQMQESIIIFQNYDHK
jgi:hypothetical protein